MNEWTHLVANHSEFNIITCIKISRPKSLFFHGSSIHDKADDLYKEKRNLNGVQR